MAAPQQSWTDRLSDPLQAIIKDLIGSTREGPRRLKSLLHGTWFGHPLHAAITVAPVGAWLLAALFDAIWLVSPRGGGWAARAAEVAILAGLVAALGAIVTGSADWSDSYGAERSAGLLHGALNLFAFIAYAVSAVLRLVIGSGESRTAAITGFVGLAIVLYAAYLGGELVFDKGTGVNHATWVAPGENYEAVMPMRVVRENQLYRVNIAGVPVILVRQGERLCAIAATCTHAGGPLDEGKLEGGVVTCPWHGSQFSVCSGRALRGPATIRQPRYAVRVRGGQVELKRL
jgi:nitrite reductase/ring-hydroxylating ferredoxin subunit/uncharacterized membrane protein